MSSRAQLLDKLTQINFNLLKAQEELETLTRAKVLTGCVLKLEIKSTSEENPILSTVTMKDSHGDAFELDEVLNIVRRVAEKNRDHLERVFTETVSILHSATAPEPTEDAA